MCPDRQRADEEMRRRPAGRCERAEFVAPNALCRLSDATLIKRFAWTKDRRGIRPTLARRQHLNDATDHPTVVGLQHTALVVRKKRWESQLSRMNCQRYLSGCNSVDRGGGVTIELVRAFRPRSSRPQPLLPWRWVADRRPPQNVIPIPHDTALDGRSGCNRRYFDLPENLSEPGD